MKQPPIKTKELSGNTVQIADGQNWEIASITAYGETPQGGTTEAPVALTGVDSVQVCGNNLLPDSAKTVAGDNIRYFYNTDGFLLLKGQAYTLVTNINSAGIYIKSSDDSSEIAVRFQAKSVTYIPDTNVRVFFDVYWFDGVPDGALVWLNLGESPLPYEPYQGSVTPLPIPRPLRRVGDVKDKCVTRQKHEGAEKLVVTYNVGYIASYAGESITTAWISSTGALSTGAEVAYVLSSPETYATDPLDIDNAAGPLTVMTGGEVEVTLTHRMLTPYTAWAIRYDSEGEYTGDFFNVEDYDRIKQNIEYLREYAYFLYGGFTLRGMVAVTVESYGYASTIDALDANLEAIAANTFRPPDMMPVKQWRGNQPPPGADDWNRIENTCLLLFEQFERQFACLPKLAFELKGSAF